MTLSLHFCFVLLVVSVINCALAFKSLPTSLVSKSFSAISNSPTAVYSLDNDTILKLEEMKNKYTRLSNVVSPEADAEKASIEEIVNKYKLYKEVKSMMSKLKMMWSKEVSERRRDKQVKSFSKLYQGKLEIEEILKQKLGLTTSSASVVIPELKKLEQIDSEIAALQSKVESTKLTLPEGKSTREARYLS